MRVAWRSILCFFFLLFSASNCLANSIITPKETLEMLSVTDDEAQNDPSIYLKNTPNPGFAYPDIFSQALILILVALFPFLVMLFTSFLKMVIALALLRSAIGIQQTPPNQVINGIALILSIYVMYPTGLEMYERAKHLIDHEMTQEMKSENTALLGLKVVNAAKEPLRKFMNRNTSKAYDQSFYELAQKTFPKEIAAKLKPSDFIVLVPAFIASQLRAAFEIGVLIYLPFFVIDLVTSNVLLAMQMMMLSPLSISLPLKLLLIVMIDGWTILVQGLVLSFR